jgi:hypothetical protein
MVRFEQHQDPNFNAKILNYTQTIDRIYALKENRAKLNMTPKQQKRKGGVSNRSSDSTNSLYQNSLSFIVIVVIVCIIYLFCGCGIKGVQTLNVANEVCQCWKCVERVGHNEWFVFANHFNSITCERN